MAIPFKRPTTVMSMLLAYSGLMSVLYILAGGLTLGFSAKKVVAFGFAGAICGAIRVTTLDPVPMPHRTAWAIALSSLACLVGAFLLDVGPFGYLLAIAVGLLLGLFARRWVTHV